eukprot:jgi/Psemu1/44476/gm1.44476_g
MMTRYGIVKEGLKNVMSISPIEDYRRNTEQANEPKLKELANKEKRKEEDRKKRSIVNWLHLDGKCWKSPEDLEEYNNYRVPCGAWGQKVVYKTSNPPIQKWNPDPHLPAPLFQEGLQISTGFPSFHYRFHFLFFQPSHCVLEIKEPSFPISEDKVVIFLTKVSDHGNFRLNGIAVKQI